MAAALALELKGAILGLGGHGQQGNEEPGGRGDGDSLRMLTVTPPVDSLLSAWNMLQKAQLSENLPSFFELTVLTAERGIELEQFDVSRQAVQTYFLSTPPVDQFYCRALFCRALCESRVIEEQELLGGKAVGQRLHALEFIKQGLDIATKNTPRYSFLVYNASIHVWKILRASLRAQTARYFADMLLHVTNALVASDEASETWLIQFHSAAAFALDDKSQTDDAVRSAAAALALADDLLKEAEEARIEASESLKLARASSRRRSSVGSREHVAAGNEPDTRREVKKETEAKEALQLSEKSYLRARSTAEGAWLAVMHVGRAGVSSPEAKKILDTCRGRAASSARLGLLLNIQQIYERQLVGNPAEAALKTAVDTLSTSSPSAMELIAEAGLAAHRVGAQDLATTCLARLDEVKGATPPAIRARADLLRACLRASSLDAVVSIRGEGNTKLAKAAAQDSRTAYALDAFKLAERALGLARRSEDAELMQSASVLLYNLARPLLSSSAQRSAVRQGLIMASAALAEIGSPLATLRARLHALIARCEMERDFLIQAAKESKASLLVDYGPVKAEETIPNKLEAEMRELGFEPDPMPAPSADLVAAEEAERDQRRPIDLLTSPLARFLSARQAVWSDSPKAAEDAVSLLLDQAKAAQVKSLRHSLLERCSIMLKDCGDHLLVAVDPCSLDDIIQALAHEALKEAPHVPPKDPSLKLHVALWSEVGRLASQAPLFDTKLTRQAFLAVLRSGVWDPVVHRHIVGLQVEAWYGIADTMVEGIEARSALQKQLPCICTGVALSVRLKSAPWLVRDGAIRLWKRCEPYFPGALWELDAASVLPIQAVDTLGIALQAILETVDTQKKKDDSWALACTLCAARAAALAKSGDLQAARASCDTLLSRNGPSATEMKPVAVLSALLAANSDGKQAAKAPGKIKGAAGSSNELMPTTSALHTLASLITAEIKGEEGIACAEHLQIALDMMRKLEEEHKALWQTLVGSRGMEGDMDLFELMESRDSTSLEHDVAEIEVHAEVWCRLSRALFHIKEFQRAVACSAAARALVPRLPHNVEKLSSLTWRWISIAETMQGMSISALIAPESQELELQDSLRADAMEVFSISVRSAYRASDSQLIASSMLRFWNVAVPMMPTPAGRKYVMKYLEDVLTIYEQGIGGANLEGIISPRVLVDFYVLLCQCHADAQEWSAGLRAAQGACARLPRSHQRALWQWTTLFLAKIGGHSGGGLLRGSAQALDSANSPAAKAEAWASLARSSEGAPGAQLASYQKGLEVLQGPGLELERAAFMLQMGTWMMSQQEFVPLTDAISCLRECVELFISADCEWCGEELQVTALPRGDSKSNSSKAFGTASTSASSLGGLARSDSLVSSKSERLTVQHSTGSLVQASARLNAVHLEMVLRALGMLARAAPSLSSRLELLFFAGRVSRRLLEVSRDTLRTLRLRRAYASAGSATEGDVPEEEQDINASPVISLEEWVDSESGKRSLLEIDECLQQEFDFTQLGWSPPADLRDEVRTHDSPEENELTLSNVENPMLALTSLMELLDLTFDSTLPCLATWHCRVGKLILAWCVPPSAARDVKPLLHALTCRVMLSLGGLPGEEAVAELSALNLGLTASQATAYQGEVDRKERSEVLLNKSDEANAPTEQLPIRKIWSALAGACAKLGFTRASAEYLWGANRHNVAFHDVANTATCLEIEASLARARGLFDAELTSLLYSARLRQENPKTIEQSAGSWGTLARRLADCYSRQNAKEDASRILLSASQSFKSAGGSQIHLNLDASVERLRCALELGLNQMDELKSSLQSARALCEGEYGDGKLAVHATIMDANIRVITMLDVAGSDGKDDAAQVQADARSLSTLALSDLSSLDLGQLVESLHLSHPAQRLASRGLVAVASWSIARARSLGQHRRTNYKVLSMNPVERWLYDTEPGRAERDAPLAADALATARAARGAGARLYLHLSAALAVEGEALSLLAARDDTEVDSWAQNSLQASQEGEDSPDDGHSVADAGVQGDLEVPDGHDSQSSPPSPHANTIGIQASQTLEQAVAECLLAGDLQSAGRASFALAELRGKGNPGATALSLMLSQSCTASIYLRTIFDGSASSDNPVFLRMERSKLLTSECQLSQSSASLPGVDLKNIIGENGEHPSVVYERLQCDTTPRVCLDSIPSNIALFSIHLSRDRGDIFAAGISADGNVPPAVSRRELPPPDKMRLDSEIPSRMEAWRCDVSKWARDCSSEPESTLMRTRASELDSELRDICSAILTILKPLLDDENVKDFLHAASEGGNHIVLLLDPILLSLPIESTLNGIGIASPVSRDFSLHLLAHRARALGESHACIDNVVAADLWKEDTTGSIEDCIELLRGDGPLKGWKNFQIGEEADSASSKWPQNSDWTAAIKLRSSGCIVAPMPGPLLGSLAPAAVATLNARGCHALILADRADTETSHRRLTAANNAADTQGKTSSVFTAGLFSLVGLQAVALSQWSTPPQEVARWLSKFLKSWQDTDLGHALLQQHDDGNFDSLLQACVVLYGLPVLVNAGGSTAATRRASGAISSGKTKK